MSDPLDELGDLPECPDCDGMGVALTGEADEWGNPLDADCRTCLTTGAHLTDELRLRFLRDLNDSRKDTP